MRRFTVLFVLALALAMPAIASATEVGGSMSESFTLEAPTISMTVPVNTTYAVNVLGHSASGDFTLTDIGTNNINGLTITARFSVLTLVGLEEPPVTIPTTSRALIGMTSDSPELTVDLLLGGSIADDATWYQIGFLHERPPRSLRPVRHGHLGRDGAGHLHRYDRLPGKHQP